MLRGMVQWPLGGTFQVLVWASGMGWYIQQYKTFLQEQNSLMTATKRAPTAHNEAWSKFCK